ncbi:isoprenylcysteine carboxylmethyltransferase family protein [Sphingobium phenoxybenzoativorans]|uniref:methanethiol S-methyltransferase n=1 Tax=Sphingobium phenoxybenzoativorans TaxID=1592790 RepID=A0A975K4N2_9SPHN|nr:methanethiol S-methyltransferase [Sphingobium phenoxybenzoativorans]QUT04771.1 isoprenylcysteine carboxylmethyltransferase family protein [Sphingobium phenoxybenzoativorans]
MNRFAYLVFGIISYLIFFAAFLYFIAFVGNFPLVPFTVDQGRPILPVWQAAAIDIFLIALFGVQHSVMARPAFKRAWTRIVPEPVERSVYVLSASIVLMLLCHFWHPIPAVLWDAGSGPLAMLLLAIFALGWLIVLLSTFLISHFELFGLKQVWSNMLGHGATEPVFRTPFFYRLVRHPLYSGFILAFWATPRMTVGHVLLAVGMTIYILIAIRHEERDLTALFGEKYVAYRGRVGMLTPRLRR